MKKYIIIVGLLLVGCASTPPTKIGADTYYSAKTNTAGIFGDVRAVVGTLIEEGNEVCTKQNKQLELVTKDTSSNIPGVRFGGASITFKCIDKPGNPIIRPDNGVTTIEIIQK